MSNSIKVDLYTAIRDTLSALLEGDADSKPLFKYVGHYNSPEISEVNNFSYKTPAVFISIDNVDWIKTAFDQPAANLTREQNGIATVTIHYFIHDLRTDSDCYIEHLEVFNKAYRSLIGLRSAPSVEGKFSSMRRIREIDDSNFENLRHWRQTYTSFIQEPPLSADQIDASPTTLELTIEKLP